MQIQAGHQLHAMVFNGLGADVEKVGDLLRILAFGDELKNLALATRQLFERAFRVVEFICRSFFEKLGGGFRAQITFLLHHPLQGGAFLSFFVPSDERDNNVKIFVVRKGLKELRFVP